MPDPSTARRGGPRRRWPAVVILVAIVLSMLALSGHLWLEPYRAKRSAQRDAVALVQELGGKFHYEHQARTLPLRYADFSSDYAFDRDKPLESTHWLREHLGDECFQTLVHIDLEGKKAGTEANLRTIARLRGLKWLNLSWNEMDDAGLARLGALTQLQVLIIDRNRITDAGLAHLATLRQLESLDLTMTRVDGSGLVHLAGLSKLRKLDLQYTRLKGEHLAHLAGHPSLEILMLGRTPVTDADLIHLAGIPNLRILDIICGGVSDAGLSWIAKNLKLIHLYLGETDESRPAITAVGLRALAEMTTLQHLAIRIEGFSRGTIDEFKQRRPDCSVDADE